MYVTAQWAVPLLQKSGVSAPSFLVTSSLLPEHPQPFWLSLSAVKASQQNVVLSLRTAFGKDIHIGVVKVGGVVSPEEKNLNPIRIAERRLLGFMSDLQSSGPMILRCISDSAWPGSTRLQLKASSYKCYHFIWKCLVSACPESC